MHPNSHAPYKFFVALDLGSESTAAYYESWAGSGDMVSLQAYAEKLLGSPTDIEYLKDGDEISPRLRTRFSIEPDRQSAPLDLAHALLGFVDENGNKLSDYDKCVLQYFHLVNQIQGRIIMPNPKIPFQLGAEGIIPEIGTSNGKIRYKPDELLKHMTIQIIRNFVLKSPELKQVKPNEIHLTLTVPNIYSLTHAESLRKFLKSHLEIGELDILYESDAVAYFGLDDIKDSDPTELKRFKVQRQNLKKKDEVRIVTIDIGRGTTDLSLIQIKQPDTGGGADETDSYHSHFVLARVGKSDGGNRLSYIFAKFYHNALLSAYKKFQHKLGASLPFNFLYGANPLVGLQWKALEHLYTLIEKVKMSFTENYTITLSENEQREDLDKIINLIFEAMDPDWSSNASFEEFRKEIKENMILNETFPGPWKVFWKGLSNRFRRAAENSDRTQNLMQLRLSIENYVKDNVVTLIDQLEEMAVSREKQSSADKATIKGKAFDKDCTVVAVAGQASQFKPVREAILGKFRKENIPEKRILFLPGVLAKEACCKGAVAFRNALVKQMNPYEIHGTYGFLPRFQIGDTTFKPIDMARFNKEEVVDVIFDAKVKCLFVYSPKPNLSSAKPPLREDGYTAVIDSFEGVRFKVQYDKANALIEVNGNSIHRTTTYGDVDGRNPKEEIFLKMWPEMVIPD